MDQHTPDMAADENPPTEPLSYSTSSKQRRSRKARIASFAVAGALLLTGGAAGGAWGASQLSATSSSTSAAASGSSSTGATFTDRGPFGGRYGGFQGSSGQDSSSGTTQSTATAATAAQKVGVVTIDTVLGYADGEAAGTGIVLTSTGEILTNNHVVSGSTKITVTVETTGKTYTARVVGTDATDDIAVLQLQNASGLQPATLASASAKTSDTVTAVGNAGGTGDLTAATGVVTALSQTITTEAESSAAAETLNGLIETDADVVAGDSGGPLTNSAGAVVGIDTAASSGNQQIQSYAIPITTALTIARQIEAGTATSKITIGYPAFLGIQVDATVTADGAAVAGAIAGTPAAKVGLAAGDVITKVGNSTISSGDDLTATLRSYRPGATVSITYSDSDGTSHTTQVTLIQGPAN